MGSVSMVGPQFCKIRVWPLGVSQHGGATILQSSPWCTAAGDQCTGERRVMPPKNPRKAGIYCWGRWSVPPGVCVSPGMCVHTGHVHARKAAALAGPAGRVLPARRIAYIENPIWGIAFEGMGASDMRSSSVRPKRPAASVASQTECCSGVIQPPRGIPGVRVLLRNELKTEVK